MKKVLTSVGPVESDLEVEEAFSQTYQDLDCCNLSPQEEASKALKMFFVTQGIIAGLKAGGMSEEGAVDLLNAYEECH